MENFIADNSLKFLRISNFFQGRYVLELYYKKDCTKNKIPPLTSLKTDNTTEVAKIRIGTENLFSTFLVLV